MKAYEKAAALRQADLQIVTGLVDAYLADSKPQKAVDYLRQAKQQLAEPATAGSSSGASSIEGPSTSSSSDGSSSSTSGAAEQAQAQQQQPVKPLDDVSLDLMLAKTYTRWRGHDNDVLATYDASIAAHPEDFRVYLAKGRWLREQGRRGDAERMFIQAKFYARDNPASAALVQRLAADPVLAMED